MLTILNIDDRYSVKVPLRVQIEWAIYTRRLRLLRVPRTLRDCSRNIERIVRALFPRASGVEKGVDT